MLTLSQLKIILTLSQEGWKGAQVARRCWDLVRSNRRALLQLFPFTTIKLIGPGHGTNADYKFTTEHDRKAADYVKSAMAEIGVEYNVLDSPETSSVPQEDSIVICGPAANVVSRKVFEQRQDIRFRFIFENDKRRWIVQHELSDGRKLTYARQEGDPIDYAILLRIPNPVASAKTLYLAAGLAGLGTMGAAWLLTKRNRYLLSELRQANVSANQPFACLIHCYSSKAAFADQAEKDLHVAILNIERC